MQKCFSEQSNKKEKIASIEKCARYNYNNYDAKFPLSVNGKWAQNNGCKELIISLRLFLI